VFVVDSIVIKKSLKQDHKPTIAVDIMGGEFAPICIINALEDFLRKQGEEVCHFFLFGTQAASDLIVSEGALSRCSSFYITKDVLSDNAKPTEVLRASKDYSMRRAVEAVAEGRADAVLSAGNTGGYMVASKLLLKAFEGVGRPCLAGMWPHRKGYSIVADLGANATLTSDLLIQHSLLASALFQAMELGAQMRLGILNIGEEDTKGAKELLESKEALQKMEVFDSVEFLEANKVFQGYCDVIITDGFTGNVMLKCAEGTVHFIFECIRKAFSGTLFSKLIGLLARPLLRKEFAILDPDKYNAAILLGLKSPAIKMHGSSKESAISDGLAMSFRLLRVDVNALLKERLKKLPNA